MHIVQERQLVADLFDRLASLERNKRDPRQAEALIAEARAPHALYALVQTTLIQDEALLDADVRASRNSKAAARSRLH